MMYKSNERLDHSQDLKLKKLAEYAKKPGSSKWFHANSGVPFKTLMDSFKSTLPDRPTIKRQHNLSSHEPQLTKGYTQNNFQIIENKLKSSINKGSGDLHVGHCYKLTPKDSKSKVDDALNYLKLREIGCSKEEAIVFCNRDRCTHRAAEFELPARLRNSQSSRSLISQDTTKYKTFNSKVDKESFKSVDRALTNYLISHNHEPEPFMKSFMVENNYETEPSSPMKKRESFFSEDLQQISMFDFKSPFKTFLEKFIYNRSEIIPKTPIQQDKIVDEIIEDFVNEPSIKISWLAPKKQLKRPENISIEKLKFDESISQLSPIKANPVSASTIKKIKESKSATIIIKELDDKIRKNILAAKIELYEKINKQALEKEKTMKLKQDKRLLLDEYQREQMQKEYEITKAKMEKAKLERIKLKENKRLKTKQYNQKHGAKVESLHMNKSADLETRVKTMLKRQRSIRQPDFV